MKYIYGPVPSWRLGSSLGIDLLSQEYKVCNFDCVYCQVGPADTHTVERRIYVPVEAVIGELNALPAVNIDYITFSGRGEPALARNLGDAIRAVKLIRKEPVAVLTNSTLIARDEVRQELAAADFVVAKLDACSPESLRAVNRPALGIEFEAIVDGIKDLRKGYRGRLALQMMFIEANKGDVGAYVRLAQTIGPDEIQVNTPLRVSAVKPLAKEEIAEIKYRFIFACPKVAVVSAYDKSVREDVVSLSDADTLKRRGKVKRGRNKRGE